LAPSARLNTAWQVKLALKIATWPSTDLSRSLEQYDSIFKNIKVGVLQITPVVSGHEVVLPRHGIGKVREMNCDSIFLWHVLFARLSLSVSLEILLHGLGKLIVNQHLTGDYGHSSCARDGPLMPLG
jgi:hypothetical protein